MDADYEEPPRRQCLAGGGSLAATGEAAATSFQSVFSCSVVPGLQMSQAQNRGAAISVEPEVEQVFHWFAAGSLVQSLRGMSVCMGVYGPASSPVHSLQAENCVDKGAAGKLWDSSPWHRPVMEKTRAFTIERAWYSILAAGHVPEVFDATRKDTFSLSHRFAVVRDKFVPAVSRPASFP